MGFFLGGQDPYLARERQAALRRHSVVRVIAIFLMMCALLLSTSFLADGILRFGRMLFVPLSGVMTFGGLGVVCYFLLRAQPPPPLKESV
jgi:hypothetical protein